MTGEKPTAGGEFDLIEQCFKPLSGEGAFNLTDDAACLVPAPHGCRQVISTDTIVEGVHFLSDDPPETVGKKALRVNLSDCAAMGARPHAYLLNLSLPHARDIKWVERFADGLRSDQDEFGITLIGGDTTCIDGPLVISVTLIGSVQDAHLLTRSGAQPGDEVWLTGVIGEGYLGLQALTRGFPDVDGYFSARYRCPTPRLGVIPDGVATACLDVSDGLMQDAGHIARQSGVTLLLEAEKVPLSSRLTRPQRSQYRAACLTGGDDYELLFTSAPGQHLALTEAARQSGVPITRIGTVTSGVAEVQWRDANGQRLNVTRQGWQHF